MLKIVKFDNQFLLIWIKQQGETITAEYLDKFDNHKEAQQQKTFLELTIKLTTEQLQKIIKERKEK
ncbi:MAG: hypothetical protein WAX79_00760 [Candidatus Omnitrophota bacterium]